jgi:hypothetical protein
MGLKGEHEIFLKFLEIIAKAPKICYPSKMGRCNLRQASTKKSFHPNMQVLHHEL